jgi:hypothetical protein
MKTVAPPLLVVQVLAEALQVPVVAAQISERESGLPMLKPFRVVA